MPPSSVGPQPHFPACNAKPRLPKSCWQTRAWRCICHWFESWPITSQFRGSWPFSAFIPVFPSRLLSARILYRPSCACTISELRQLKDQSTFQTVRWSFRADRASQINLSYRHAYRLSLLSASPPPSPSPPPPQSPPLAFGHVPLSFRSTAVSLHTPYHLSPPSKTSFFFFMKLPMTQALFSKKVRACALSLSLPYPYHP